MTKGIFYISTKLHYQIDQKKILEMYCSHFVSFNPSEREKTENWFMAVSKGVTEKLVCLLL